MINFLLCAKNKQIKEAVLNYAKRTAVTQSDEIWDYVICDNEAELEKAVEDKEFFDIICLDISFTNGIDMLKVLRKGNPSAYILALSNEDITADRFVRPDIMTAGAVLTGQSDKRLNELLKLNFDHFFKGFYGDCSELNFILDNRDGRQLIPFNKIFYFEAFEKKIMLYTSKDKYSFYGTIDSLEKQLSDDFVRCHRSFIVRKDKISKIRLSQGFLLLEQGEMIPVSRTYRLSVKELR